MPTRLDTNFAHLSHDTEFESLIRDICAREWQDPYQDPYTEKHGRAGQKQYGVDIYGRPIDLGGKYRAAQCKLRTTQKQLSQQDIEQEVSEARGFPHPLETLIIVTDAPRDTQTQRLIEHVSQREQQNNGCRVAIWFWDDITERFASYPPLIIKYYPEYFANLTTLPLVERLKGLPDGILCHYAAPLEEVLPSNMLGFAGHVLRYLPESPQACPMFVVLPFAFREVFVQSVATLGGDLHTMHILSNALSSEAIANCIFQAVFDYGYTRRGGIATIDIAVRTQERKPNGVLLDLDWHTQLSPSQLPTPEVWQTTFVPALTAVRHHLIRQSDRTRVQIQCQLPLPAAFAVGFFLNDPSKG